MGNPAPITGYPVERPTRSRLDHGRAKDDNEAKEGPDPDQGAIADIVCDMPAKEENVEGVDGDHKAPEGGAYIACLLDDGLGGAV